MLCAGGRVRPLATPISRHPQIVRIRRPRWTPNVVDVQQHPDGDAGIEALLADESSDTER